MAGLKQRRSFGISVSGSEERIRRNGSDGGWSPVGLAYLLVLSFLAAATVAALPTPVSGVSSLNAGWHMEQKTGSTNRSLVEVLQALGRHDRTTGGSNSAPPAIGPVGPLSPSGLTTTTRAQLQDVAVGSSIARPSTTTTNAPTSATTEQLGTPASTPSSTSIPTTAPPQPPTTAVPSTEHPATDIPSTVPPSTRPPDSTMAPTTTPVPAPAPTTTRPPTTTTVATVPSTTTTQARPDPTVHPWVHMSRDQFLNFVDGRGFDTVEFVTPNVAHGVINRDGQHINVAVVHRSRTQAMRVSPGDRPADPVGRWAAQIGATVGINANWFGPYDGPAVSQGKVYGGIDHSYTALFGFTGRGGLVTHHHREVRHQVPHGVVEAVAGHPTLVHNGVVTTDFGNDPSFAGRHPRTAIGVNQSTDVLILVTVDGRRSDAAGMDGAETARLLRRLGAHEAVMLDGGGSSAMWIAGKGIVNQPSDPARAVGNQIAAFG